MYYLDSFLCKVNTCTSISAHTMRRHITLSKLGYSSCEITWLLFSFEMREFRKFSEKILISPIWFLNFLAYAEKFFSVTRWIGQIELHVTSASELPITWFRSIHWNFPLKYEIEIFKKTTSLYFAIWNSGSANDS